METNSSFNLNSKRKSWIKPIYTFFVVAIPSFFIWFFLSNDFESKNVFLVWAATLIAIGFLLAIFLITIFLIYFKVLDIYVLNFALPVAITFMVIYLTSYISLSEEQLEIEITIRSIIVLLSTTLTFPISMLVKKTNIKIIARENIRNKK